MITATMAPGMELLSLEDVVDGEHRLPNQSMIRRGVMTAKATWKMTTPREKAAMATVERINEREGVGSA
jgi:hypothetical protein